MLHPDPNALPVEINGADMNRVLEQTANHCRLAVVGSRGWPNPPLVVAAIMAVPQGTVILTGDASGVDELVRATAKRRGLALEVFPAIWAQHGKRAGAVRNLQLVRECDSLLAFWDGVSPGTRITLRMAAAAGKLQGVIYPLPDRPGVNWKIDVGRPGEIAALGGEFPTVPAEPASIPDAEGGPL